MHIIHVNRRTLNKVSVSKLLISILVSVKMASDRDLLNYRNFEMCLSSKIINEKCFINFFFFLIISYRLFWNANTIITFQFQAATRSKLYTTRWSETVVIRRKNENVYFELRGFYDDHFHSASDVVSRDRINIRVSFNVRK